MNDFSFLKNLAVVMIAGGAAALVCHWLRQPRVLGFIVAGLIIGPHNSYFPLIQDESTILTLGDIGLVFLMFSLGLEFNLRKLTSVGGTTFITAFVDVAFMFWLGFVLGRMMGWNAVESVFLGAIICDSSTTVITRILQEFGQARERFAAIVISATIVEDLIAIVLITLLTGIAITGSVSPEQVMFRIGELVTFIVVVLLVGVIVVRRIIDYVSRWKNDELLLITVLGLCFSVSLVAAEMQFSLALGAFMIGAIIAESRAVDRIITIVEPVRNTFGPLFFVAMGMLIEPALVMKHSLVIMLLIAAVMIGKVAAGSLGAFLSGNDRETSIRVGCGLAQICEFAIIFAALGRSLNATSDHVYSIAVATAVGTIFLNPHLVRFSGKLSGVLDAIMPGPVTGTLAIYTRWYRNAFRGSGNPAVNAIVKRSIITMAVNLCLIVAVFISATLLAKLAKPPFELPQFLGGAGSLYGLAGALICIPLYVATIRKLNAMSMLAAEMKFPMDSERPHAALARALAQKIILLAGVTALGVFTLMLSSVLLPAFHSLLILLGVVAIVTLVFWKFQIRLYSRAQTMLRDAFATREDQFEDKPEAPAPPPAPLAGGAHLLTVAIGDNSTVVGKTISETHVTAQTGAAIIGIERDGQSLVRPGLKKIIRAGDKLLLMGHEEQNVKAAALLEETRPEQAQT